MLGWEIIRNIFSFLEKIGILDTFWFKYGNPTLIIWLFFSGKIESSDQNFPKDKKKSGNVFFFYTGRIIII